MPLNLVVFDLDGTLTDTSRVDGECFLAALSQEFGMSDIDTDWSTYSDFTDSGILAEIFQTRRHRDPTEEEIGRHVGRFVALLAEEHRSDPGRYAPVPGAAELVAALRPSRDWDMSIATGGWARSARLKLTYADLDIGDCAFASANDALSRKGIVGTSIERAEIRNGGRPFDRIVLMGDTIWDLRAASRMRLPFVGVARGDEAAVLRTRGARAIVPDLRNPERMLARLTSAEVAVFD